MAFTFRKISALAKKYPLLKGMATYTVLWPTSYIVQQTFQGRRDEITLAEIARYGIYASCIVAPGLFLWVKTSSAIFPGQSLKIALKKVLLEQFTYAPYAISVFYISINLMEGKSWAYASDELKRKFFPTYKAGLMVWPIAQTINFAVIKESNRVPFAAAVSFFWAVFLCYMKHLDQNNFLSSTDRN